MIFERISSKRPDRRVFSSIGPRKIWNSRLARTTSVMMFGQGGSFVLQAAYFLLIARLLGTTEYGIYAGAFALVNTVTPYSVLGSPMLFMRHVSADRSLAQIYWGNSLATTAGITFLLLGLLPWIASHLLGKGLAGVILTLTIANCLTGQVVNSASIVFQTFERMRATALLRLSSNALRVVALIILMLMYGHATVFQCSMAILVGSSLAAFLSLAWVRSVIGDARINRTLFLRRFWEGIGFSVAGSTQAAYNDTDKILLSHYGMNAADGIYTVAYRLADFATTPVAALDSVALPRYFKLNTEGVSSVLNLASKLIPIAVLLGFGASFFTLLSSPLVLKVIGHGFSETLIAVRWLCWLPGLRAIHQLSGSALTATGFQNHRTVAQLFVALLNLGMNLVLIPTHGWLGAAWASLISDGLLGGINLFLLFVVRGNRQTESSTYA